MSVRNIRRDGNEAVKKLLKDKKITEDDEKRAPDEIQKMTDTYMQRIDQAAKTKEKEILEIGRTGLSLKTQSCLTHTNFLCPGTRSAYRHRAPTWDPASTRSGWPSAST